MANKSDNIGAEPDDKKIPTGPDLKAGNATAADTIIDQKTLDAHAAQGALSVEDRVLKLEGRQGAVDAKLVELERDIDSAHSGLAMLNSLPSKMADLKATIEGAGGVKDAAMSEVKSIVAKVKHLWAAHTGVSS